MSSPGSSGPGLRLQYPSNLPKGFQRFGFVTPFRPGGFTHLGLWLGLLMVKSLPGVSPKPRFGPNLDSTVLIFLPSSQKQSCAAATPAPRTMQSTWLGDAHSRPDARTAVVSQLAGSIRQHTYEYKKSTKGTIGIRFRFFFFFFLIWQRALAP